MTLSAGKLLIVFLMIVFGKGQDEDYGVSCRIQIQSPEALFVYGYRPLSPFGNHWSDAGWWDLLPFSSRNVTRFVIAEQDRERGIGVDASMYFWMGLGSYLRDDCNKPTSFMWDLSVEVGRVSDTIIKLTPPSLLLYYYPTNASIAWETNCTAFSAVSQQGEKCQEVSVNANPIQINLTITRESVSLQEYFQAQSPVVDTDYWNAIDSETNLTFWQKEQQNIQHLLSPEQWIKSYILDGYNVQFWLVKSGYNSVAWTIGDTQNWHNLNVTTTDILSFYGRFGYERIEMSACRNGHLQHNLVAIYCISWNDTENTCSCVLSANGTCQSSFTHAAIKHEGAKNWTSKVGAGPLLSHTYVDGFNLSVYGKPSLCLKKNHQGEDLRCRRLELQDTQKKKLENEQLMFVKGKIDFDIPNKPRMPRFKLTKSHSNYQAEEDKHESSMT